MEQTNTTTLAALRKPAASDIRAGFDTEAGFELMQRGASLLANSTIVPSAFRRMIEKNNQVTENKSALSNCVVALNMAQRMGADPLMVMQNLYIVEGRPSWSSQFIIASINASGKYSPLRFEITEGEDREVEYTVKKWVNHQGGGRGYYEEKQVKATIKDRTCVAWATEKATGERLESPKVTMEMAVQEGWYGKNGSKWQTMPEVMLRYRAAAFFGRIYAPELLMGLQTAEEVHDQTFDLEQTESGVYTATVAELKKDAADHNPETGEVQDTPENAEKSARAEQLAALQALREEAKAAWEATGATLEEAEKLANAFQPKWTTAQCNKVLAEAQNRATKPHTVPTPKTFHCKSLGREVSIEECQNGCPEIGDCSTYSGATA